MSSIEDIRHHRFERQDRLLLDTNIRLFLYGPLGNSSPALRSIYSRAFGQIRDADCTLYLEPLVLCEFANRYARIEQEASQYKGWEFKLYRATDYYRQVAEAVADSIKRIYVMCTPCELGFVEADVYDLVDEFQRGDHDFNDALIADLCRRQDLTLVTHDSDFRHLRLRILTANRDLLASIRA